jgi:hypothetical protein
MAETYTGEVRNGMIVLDEGTPPLPEGMKVVVEPVEVDMEAAVQDLSRRLLSLAGIAKGLPTDRAEQVAGTSALLVSWARKAEQIAPPLPSDLAENHDHYAHGKPRE